MPGYRELDYNRIRVKIADIRESLAVLNEYAGRSDEAFLENPEAIRSARYALIVAIEAATNLGNHFCSRILNKAPNSYAETFGFLGEAKLITMDWQPG
jgi:uncharacterized protein YutE (UPF0331/DUF86 family)